MLPRWLLQVYMVARLSPLYELTEDVLLFILYVGSITAFFLGLVALVQNDIKRIIAYSTISQLGYMTAALGASLYSLAIFHLITHAFLRLCFFYVLAQSLLNVTMSKI